MINISQNITINFIDNITAPLKNIMTGLNQYTKALNQSTQAIIKFQELTQQTGKKTKETENPLMQSAKGFIELTKSVLSARKNIIPFADLIKHMLDGTIKEELIGLGKEFMNLGKTIFGAFKNSLYFIWSLFTQKGKLQEVIGVLGDYIKKIITTGIEAFKTGLRMAGTFFRAIGLMIIGIVNATAAQLGFNVAMSANPLGLLIIGIMAVIGAIVLVISYWDEIKAAIARFVVWVFENSPFGFLINVVDNIFPGFKDALGGLFGWVVETFTKIADFIKGIWTSIKSWFGFGDGEEATVTVSPDENGTFTGDATDANGDPLELGLGAGAKAGQDVLMKAAEDDVSRSVTDYTNSSPEAISRPASTASPGNSSTTTNNSKNISVRIENLVKNLNLNVTNMQEGSAKIRDEVNRALIAAIRDTEIAIG